MIHIISQQSWKILLDWKYKFSSIQRMNFFVFSFKSFFMKKGNKVEAKGRQIKENSFFKRTHVKINKIASTICELCHQKKCLFFSPGKDILERVDKVEEILRKLCEIFSELAPNPTLIRMQMVWLISMNSLWSLIISKFHWCLHFHAFTTHAYRDEFHHLHDYLIIKNINSPPWNSL